MAPQPKGQGLSQSDELEDFVLARAPEFVRSMRAPEFARSMRAADADLRAGRGRHATEVFAELDRD